MAAQAGVQVVAIPEEGHFRAATNLRAGANVAGGAATAARPGRAEGAERFETTRNSRPSLRPNGGVDSGASFPMGMRLGRLGEFFRVGQGESLPVQMWPSPFPSPERPGRAVGQQGLDGPLFTMEAAQQLQVVQDRAPLLFGSPKS